MQISKSISAALIVAMSISLFSGCSVAVPDQTDAATEPSTTVSSVTDNEPVAMGDSEAPTDAAQVSSDLMVDFNLEGLSEDKKERLREGYLDFSFDYLKKSIETESGGRNIMVSPASIMLALDMTAAGAKGETLAQMTGLFGDAEDPSSQLAYAAYLLERLNSAEGVKLHAADSVWINRDIIPAGLSDDYYSFIRKKFEAEAESLVFDEAAKDKINGWVNDNTNKMIPRIVDRLDPTMAMMLINAICFEGKWADQYDDSQVAEADFTASDGSISKVQMMNGISSTYLENDIAEGFIKEYQGGQYAFVVMLPKDKTQSAGQMLSLFDGKTFDEYLKNASGDYSVRTKMPEFSYDWDKSILKDLKALGMEKPCSPSADFSRITDLAYGESLYIGDVIHKTHIEVDRNGTKAAAVTAVMLRKNAVFFDPGKEKEVFCDRPFAYAIVDLTDNTPVFLGTVDKV
ncbi:MAG: serpin family protein [Clostridiales bacterium]|nr:serpin family protein [Clostridiales bacterium]